MDKITWRVKDLYKADPNKVYEEIKQLGDTHTHQMVVDMARNPETESHKCFEWNDTVAAEKWRLNQARIMESSLVYEPERKENAPIRVFSLTDKPKEYRETRLMVRDEKQYQTMLNRAMAELHSFRQKYESLVELKELFKEIDKLTS